MMPLNPFWPVVRKQPEHSRFVSREDIRPATDFDRLRFHVDIAYVSTANDLLLIGALFDPDEIVKGISLFQDWREALLRPKKRIALDVNIEDPGVGFARFGRSGPGYGLSAGKAPGKAKEENGFILILPHCEPFSRVAFQTASGQYIQLSAALTGNRTHLVRSVTRLWNELEPDLLRLLESTLGADHDLTTTIAHIRQVGAERALAETILKKESRRPGSTMPKLAHRIKCEHAFLLDGRWILLDGWISYPAERVEQVKVTINDVVMDLTHHLCRYPRPELLEEFPHSARQPPGFMVLLAVPNQRFRSLRIQLSRNNGGAESVEVLIEKAGIARVVQTLQRNPLALGTLFSLLESREVLEPAGQRAGLDSGTVLEHLLSRSHQFPTFVDTPRTLMVSIDRTFPLGHTGLLVFGWAVFPLSPPDSVTAYGENGEAADVTHRFVPLLRQDVLETYRSSVAAITEWSGFCCLVPIPTFPGEERIMRFSFGALGEVWLRLPANEPPRSALDPRRDLLAMIPAPERMRQGFFDLFERGLGDSLESLQPRRTPPDPNVRQFGRAPATPDISVIVPLWGRYDFLRYQLAEFANDPAWQEVDLIYVIDDPSIHTPVLELAARYAPLFKIPFRVVWYERNLGFAGANNVGTTLARGAYLVLMNSDVFPQHAGWLKQLRDALDHRADSGAVGPLLEFADGTTQHAGMLPRTEATLPGFLFNSHVGMGLTWQGQSEPSEQPMLTAACLMTRTSDYNRVGGLDEGYLVGDFEDSDLCMTLRKLGRRMYLVPSAKLWHLERQSQTLGNISSQRELITLYNAWRYTRKVQNGVIADPRCWQDNDGDAR